MKAFVFYTFACLLLSAIASRGQGTLVFDQQSSIDESVFPNGIGPTIQQIAPPYGQSFTPGLSGIDFIRLNLNDRNPSNGLGATLFINLRITGVNGVVIAATDPVIMADSFSGPVSFFFSSTVTLIPGSVYYFDPVVQSGDQWNLLAGEYNYPGGMVYANGLPGSGSDYWFREGIFAVPEPSAGWLVLFGLAAFFIRYGGRANGIKGVAH